MEKAKLLRTLDMMMSLVETGHISDPAIKTVFNEGWQAAIRTITTIVMMEKE